MEIRVYYEDTDAAGVVYHSNYLNFMERGRTELFRTHGLIVSQLAAEGFIFPVVRVEADFKAPAFHDDLLRIETNPVTTGGSSFQLAQRIIRENDRKIIVDALVTLACINLSGKPVRIPAEVLSFLKSTLQTAK